MNKSVRGATLVLGLLALMLGAQIATAAPAITPVITGVQGTGGWYTGAVTIDWTVSDPTNPITSQTDCGPVVLANDSAGTSFTCTATSAGGTISSTVTIMRDATAPSIQWTSPPDNAGYHVGNTVLANFNCSDTLSGMNTCVGTVDSGVAIDTATAGPKTFVVTAVDVAGNTQVFTRHYTVQPAVPLMMINTVAGRGPSGPVPALTAAITVAAEVIDASGNIYVATGGNRPQVVKIDPSGSLTVVAGNGTPGYSGDGHLAVNAQLVDPRALSLDPAGNLYIYDMFVGIRKVDASTRIISTLNYSAQLPIFDSAGNTYLNNGNSIDKIDKITGVTVLNWAGTGTSGYSGDGGPAAKAQFGAVNSFGAAKGPVYLAFDGLDNLYIADSGNYCIRKIDAKTGNISTVAGTGTVGAWVDGASPTASQIGTLFGIAADAIGNVYFQEDVSAFSSHVAKIDSSGSGIHLIHANNVGDFTSQGRGSAIAAPFRIAGPLAVDAAGVLYIGLNKMLPTGSVSLGGNGTVGYSGDGGLAAEATLAYTESVAADANGGLWITDIMDNRIRKVDGAGIISTVGPAVNPAIYFTWDNSIAVVESGDLYFSDTYHGLIQKIDTAGNITTVAGTGTPGYGGDNGPATSAAIDHPGPVIFDSAGNLYFSDSWNNRIRMIDASGTITTIAGNGVAGYGGDGGPATSATLNLPSETIAFDAAGNLFIPDSGNCLVRRVDKISKTITTIAGNGLQCNLSFPTQFIDEGALATNAALSGPGPIAFDSVGNLYIADVDQIRRVDHLTQIIATVVGHYPLPAVNSDWDGTADGDGGPALDAWFPIGIHGLVIDNFDNMYIAAPDSNRIRAVVVGTGALPLDNSTLSVLTVSSGGISPAFSSSLLSYTAAVDNTLNSLTVTPTVRDQAATVTVNGTTVSSGIASAPIALNVGQNILSVVVTAPNGTTTQTYQIVVTRNPPASALALVPTSISVIAGNNSNVSISGAVGAVTATPNDATIATVKISGNTLTVTGVGLGSTTISVSDSQKTVTLSVSVTPVVLSSNANLGGLIVSSGSLSPGFSSGTITYSDAVANAVSSITVTPTVADPTATITVNNGTPVISGTASQPIPLSVGANQIAITVTAQSGATQTYFITVTRASSSNSRIGAIAVSNGTLSRVFEDSVLSYSVNATSTSSAPIIALGVTLEDSTATLVASSKVNGLSNNATQIAIGTSGTQFVVTVPLAAQTTISLAVTAQDGSITTYVVSVNLATGVSADADLGGLVVSGGILAPIFTSANVAYMDAINASKASLTLTATPADLNATLTAAASSNSAALITPTIQSVPSPFGSPFGGSYALTVPLGADPVTITITVTAPDGVTQKNYTVTTFPAAAKPMVVSGNGHNCALTSTGAVWCWGDGTYGQLGPDPNVRGNSAAFQVTGLPNDVVSLAAAGGNSTCALTSDGVMWCWGLNNYGQLGSPAVTAFATATPVATQLYGSAAAITVGGTHACALMTTGGALCWGSNAASQRGNGTTNNNFDATPSAVQGFGGSGVSLLSAGINHTCLMTTSGQIKCFGDDRYVQAGSISTTGGYASPTDVAPTLNATVSGIAADTDFTCTLVQADGTVRCWGYNGSGQLGVGWSTFGPGNTQFNPYYSLDGVLVSGLAGVQAIAVGDGPSFAPRACAITSTQGVACWGSNASGILGNGADPTISPNFLTPQAVNGLDGVTKKVTSISVGGYGACAVLSTGEVDCWGGFDGNTVTNPSSTPVPVEMNSVSGGGSLNVGQAAQTLSFLPLPDVSAGAGSITLSAVSSSGLPVSFFAGPSTICTLSATNPTVVNLVGPGQCSVTANQLGNGIYAPATPVSQHFNVLLSQTISFTTTAPSTATVGGASYTPKAIATSNLPVVITLDVNSTGCTMSGAVSVTFTGVGTCVIDANQAGNAIYGKAAQVQQIISVNNTAPVITWPAPAAITYGTPLSATQLNAASGGVPGTFAYSPSAGTVLNAGTGYVLSVTFTPADTTTYSTASATTTITVNKASQTINFTSVTPTNVTVASATYTPTAAATSGLAVAFSVDATSTLGACSITGGVVSFTGAGSCVIDANQAGNGNYAAATQVQQPITVTGAGGGTVTGLSPTTLTFPGQLVGTTSAAQTVTVTNAGTTSLTVVQISITGNFARTTTCGSTLAAGASCTISVTFTPRAAGALSGTLTVGTIGTVALSGTGQAPSASITPPTFAFANQQVGTTSAEQVFTYTNTGPVPITVATVTLGGAGRTSYAISSNGCNGVTLAPTATCTIGVTFTPTAANNRAATLAVTDITGGAPRATASLSGTGVAPAINLRGRSNYGPVTVPTTATFTLANTGTAPFVISTVALTTGTQYKITGGTCAAGGTVANAGSCTVIVTFTPVGTTTITDTLTVSGTDVGTGAPTYTATRALTGR